MKKINKTPLAAVMGSAVVSAFSATAVQAENDPFAMTELSDGYMQVAESGNHSGYTVKPWGKKANEASCGEGKCGGMMDGDKMKKGLEKACGAMMEKGKEGACGNMDKKPAEQSEGMGDMAGMKDGGDMKCGAMMKKMKGKMGDMKGGDMACGAMMKKMKGKMGDMKGGDMACGAMMGKMKDKMGDMKGKMGGGDMKSKGGEMSCGSKIDPANASGE